MSSKPVPPTFDSHIDGLKEAITTLQDAIKAGGKDADKDALAAEKKRVEAQLARVKKQAETAAKV